LYRYSYHIWEEAYSLLLILVAMGRGHQRGYQRVTIALVCLCIQSHDQDGKVGYSAVSVATSMG
jgi:hypothetical protein